jgi:hypothetical protein
MGYLIVVSGFLFLGWFGAKLISMGLAGMRSRALDVGFHYRLRGRPATGVAALLLLVGALVIAPFVFGVAYLLIGLIGRYFSAPA